MKWLSFVVGVVVVVVVKVPVCKIVDFKVSIKIVKNSHFGFPGRQT